MSIPQLVIAARPATVAHFKDLFTTGTESITSILEKPGSFRHAGWTLETLDQARIVNGEYLEVKNGDRKTIRVYEDGTLLARVNADSSFLGWGQSAADFAKRPRLNPLAAIELVASFVHLYARLIPYLDRQPDEICLHVELTDAKVEERYLYTTAGELHSIAWIFDDDKRALTSGHAEKDVSLQTSDTLEDTNYAAFKVVERLFLLFGVAPNDIPYTTELKGRRRIDVDRFPKG